MPALSHDDQKSEVNTHLTANHKATHKAAILLYIQLKIYKSEHARASEAGHAHSHVLFVSEDPQRFVDSVSGRSPGRCLGILRSAGPFVSRRGGPERA